MILLAWKKMRGAVAQWISDYLWGNSFLFFINNKTISEEPETYGHNKL